MDLANIPFEDAVRLVKSGQRQLGEFPRAVRVNIENYLEQEVTVAVVPSKPKPIVASMEMKKTELQTIAIELRIEFSPSNTKAELLEMIEEAQNASDK